MKTHTFSIRYRGVCPFDMLRYDRASPARGVDAENLGVAGNTVWHEVTLQSPYPPTIQRWLSFGIEIAYKGVRHHP